MFEEVAGPAVVRRLAWSRSSGRPAGSQWRGVGNLSDGNLFVLVPVQHACPPRSVRHKHRITSSFTNTYAGSASGL